MAVQIYSNPLDPSGIITIAQAYDILKQLEGTFFGTVTLTEQDGNTPAYVMCTHKDTGVNLLQLNAPNNSPTSSGSLYSPNIIGYFYDGENITMGILALGTSSYIHRIGICNNGIIFSDIGAFTNVVVAFDAYEDYTFLYAPVYSSNYYANKPKSYSYEAYSSAKEYNYSSINNNDGQMVLGAMPVPIMASGHPYNYIKDVYVCTVRDNLITGLSHVMIGDDHYISVATTYFLKD